MEAISFHSIHSDSFIVLKGFLALEAKAYAISTVPHFDAIKISPPRQSIRQLLQSKEIHHKLDFHEKHSLLKTVFFVEI